jgi:DNA-binding LytR/AlgR family response regulator
MIRAIAIDDEPPALRLLGNFCRQAAYVQLLKTFTKPHEAIEWLKGNTVDLLFLDIRMPSVSGIDLFKSLEQKPLVIFTTAYSEYAVEGFDLDVVDYLLKPFTYERFLKATAKAKEYYEYLNSPKTPDNFIIIRADYSLNKVMLADILFIESAGDYLKFHLLAAKTLVARMTMKHIMEKLPADKFFRMHRSYIAAAKHIVDVGDKTVLIAGKELPMGLNYEKEFMLWWSKQQ